MRFELGHFGGVARLYDRVLRCGKLYISICFCGSAFYLLSLCCLEAISIAMIFATGKWEIL